MAWVPNKSAGQQIKAYQEIECVIGVTYNTKKKEGKRKKKEDCERKAGGVGLNRTFMYISGDLRGKRYNSASDSNDMETMDGSTGMITTRTGMC